MCSSGHTPRWSASVGGRRSVEREQHAQAAAGGAGEVAAVEELAGEPEPVATERPACRRDVAEERIVGAGALVVDDAGEAGAVGPDAEVRSPAAVEDGVGDH